MGKEHEHNLYVVVWLALVTALVTLLFVTYLHLSTYELGCPYWPGCPGRDLAPLAAKDVGKTVTIATGNGDLLAKQWLMFFQYGLIGLLALWLIGATAEARKAEGEGIHCGWPLALSLLFWVGLLMSQLIPGQRPTPGYTILQNVTGISILALLWWGLLRQNRLLLPLAATTEARRLRPYVLAAIGLVGLQLLLGTWVSAHHAGLACPDFPACQGSWWPPMAFKQGFAYWATSGEQQGLDLAATTAIHVSHRFGALLVLGFVGGLAVTILRRHETPGLCRYGLVLCGLLAALFLFAVLQVLWHLPIALTMAHNVLAVLVLLGLMALWHVLPPAIPQQEKKVAKT